MSEKEKSIAEQMGDLLDDLLIGRKRVSEIADRLADLLDQVPEYKGTDLPKQIRDARFDTDRLIEIMDRVH